MDGCGFVRISRLVDKMGQDMSPEEVLQIVRQDDKVGTQPRQSGSAGTRLLAGCSPEPRVSICAFQLLRQLGRGGAAAQALQTHQQTGWAVQLAVAGSMGPSEEGGRHAASGCSAG